MGNLLCGKVWSRPGWKCWLWGNPRERKKNCPEMITDVWMPQRRRNIGLRLKLHMFQSGGNWAALKYELWEKLLRHSPLSGKDGQQMYGCLKMGGTVF